MDCGLPAVLGLPTTRDLRRVFVSLPLQSLDQLTLQKRLDSIGKTKDASADSESTHNEQLVR
jgi:hypothetical protein